MQCFRLLKLPRILIGCCSHYLERIFFVSLNVQAVSLYLIGNEVSDEECLKKVGLSAVPADACSTAQKAVGYICRYNGGRGALREFAEHIFLLMEKVVNSCQK